MWPGKPQFWGVQAAAANLGYGQGAYTAEMFQADFPQFFSKGSEEAPSVSLVPPAMLEELICQANAAIQPDKWLEGWRYACGLYAAHYATLYLRTYAEGGAVGQAGAGQHYLRHQRPDPRHRSLGRFERHSVWPAFGRTGQAGGYGRELCAVSKKRAPIRRSRLRVFDAAPQGVLEHTG